MKTREKITKSVTEERKEGTVRQSDAGNEEKT